MTDADATAATVPEATVVDSYRETFALEAFTVGLVPDDDTDKEDEDFLNVSVMSTDGRMIAVVCDDAHKCCERPFVVWRGAPIAVGAVVTSVVVVRNDDDNGSECSGRVDYSGRVELHTAAGCAAIIDCSNEHNGYYPRTFTVLTNTRCLSRFSM